MDRGIKREGGREGKGVGKGGKSVGEKKGCVQYTFELSKQLFLFLIRHVHCLSEGVWCQFRHRFLQQTNHQFLSRTADVYTAECNCHYNCKSTRSHPCHPVTYSIHSFPLCTTQMAHTLLSDYNSDKPKDPPTYTYIHTQTCAYIQIYI